MSDLGTELGDGVCDFEKVPPDQLCSSAKRRLTGSSGLASGLGLGFESCMIDQDEAARSAGEGAKEAHREQEKLSVRGGRKGLRARVRVRRSLCV